MQYLFTSSPLFDMMVVAPEDLKDSRENLMKSETSIGARKDLFTVADGLMLLTEKFIDDKIMDRCIVSSI